MRHYVVLATLCLLPIWSAAADTIHFSYSGAGVNASGDLSATEIAAGEYLITGVIDGQRNGNAITSFVPLPAGDSPGTPFVYQDTAVDNLIFIPSADYFSNTNADGFVFGTADGLFNPYLDLATGKIYEYKLNSGVLPGTQINFSATLVPEPAGYSAVGTSLLALLALRRRKHAA